MRAISPLIAAILLLGLTVAIGAIVIQWGKSYVQQQVSCVAISDGFDILSYQKGTSSLQLQVYYLPKEPLAYNDIVVKLYTTAGNVYVCSYQKGATSAPTGGCVFDVTATATGVTNFQSGQTYNIKVLVDPGTININQISRVEIYVPACRASVGGSYIT